MFSLAELSFFLCAKKVYVFGCKSLIFLLTVLTHTSLAYSREKRAILNWSTNYILGTLDCWWGDLWIGIPLQPTDIKWCFKICTIESRNPVTRLIVRLISRDHSKVGWLNRCYLRVSILPQQNLITKWSVSDLLCYWIIILFNSTKPKINPRSVKSGCFEQSA